MFTQLSRPNHIRYKSFCNVNDGDRIEAYRRAARKLGIKIKFSYPVPCLVGADLCDRLGMKGVYISRKNILKEDILSTEMFRQLRMMSE